MSLSERLVFSGSDLNASNKYDKLINSFTNICRVLESQADERKRLVDCEVAASSSEVNKAADNLIDSLQNVSEAVSEIIHTNSCLEKDSTRYDSEYLEVPYDIQSDLIQCLRNTFRIKLPDNECDNVNLIPKSKIESLADLQKAIECNVNNLENFQCIVNGHV